MSTISSEYFGGNSGRYSAANQPGKYKGFGVVDFAKGTVGDNYEPYPMASDQLTGGSAVMSPFVKPAGKIYKFMQPKVTMPAMMPSREPAYPTMLAQPAVSAHKKASTYKRKSAGKRSASKRHTKKTAGRR